MTVHKASFANRVLPRSLLPESAAKSAHSKSCADRGCVEDQPQRASQARAFWSAVTCHRFLETRQWLRLTNHQRPRLRSALRAEPLSPPRASLPESAAESAHSKTAHSLSGISMTSPSRSQRMLGCCGERRSKTFSKPGCFSEPLRVTLTRLKSDEARSSFGLPRNSDR